MGPNVVLHPHRFRRFSGKPFKRFCLRCAPGVEVLQRGFTKAVPSGRPMPPCAASSALLACMLRNLNSRDVADCCNFEVVTAAMKRKTSRDDVEMEREGINSEARLQTDVLGSTRPRRSISNMRSLKQWGTPRTTTSRNPSRTLHNRHQQAQGQFMNAAHSTRPPPPLSRPCSPMAAQHLVSTLALPLHSGGGDQKESFRGCGSSQVWIKLSR
jgi:hypothetical protein